MGHIRPNTLIAAAIVLAGGSASAAPPNADSQADLPPGVLTIEPHVDPVMAEQLIADLAHDDWHVRQAAHRRIVDLGPAILPTLEERLARVETLHLRNALGLVIEETRQAAAGQGTLIHAAFEHAATADVLRLLQAQSGVTLGVDVLDPAQAVSATFDGWTWWQTIGWLCQEHDWDLRVSASGMAIRPAGSVPTMGGPVDLTGPLAVFCRGAGYGRDLILSRAGDRPWPTPDALQPDQTPAVRFERGVAFNYNFEGYLEPRFIVGSRNFEVAWTEARDDAGNTLLPAGAADIAGMTDDLLGLASPVAPEKGLTGNRSEATWQSGRLVFSAPLVFPRDPGSTLSLAGRLRGSVGADLTQYECTTTPMMHGTRWLVAGEQVEVRAEAGRTPNRWIVSFTTLRDPFPATVDVMITAFGGAELYDQEGRKLRRGTAFRQEGPGGGIIYRMEFIGPDSERPVIPTRLVATLPARLVELDLPFRFENLPMP